MVTQPSLRQAGEESPRSDSRGQQLPTPARDPPRLPRPPPPRLCRSLEPLKTDMVLTQTLIIKLPTVGTGRTGWDMSKMNQGKDLASNTGTEPRTSRCYEGRTQMPGLAHRGPCAGTGVFTGTECSSHRVSRGNHKTPSEQLTILSIKPQQS